MKVSLIHPSRQRAEQAMRTYKSWLSKASGKHEIEHILSLDANDIQLPYYKVIFDKHGTNDNQKLIISNNRNCVEATNVAAKQATGEMLIYFSDDFDCPVNWDEELVKSIPVDKDKWCLWVRDGITDRDNKQILCIPIISKTIYDTLGYFWYPEYKSMFCDEDLYWVYANNRWIYRKFHLTFEHKHFMNGKAKKDDTYNTHASPQRYNEGKAIFERRQREGFK